MLFQIIIFDTHHKDCKQIKKCKKNLSTEENEAEQKSKTELIAELKPAYISKSNSIRVIIFDEKNCQNTLMSIEIHLIKHPFVKYAGFGTLSDKPNGCDNNSQKSFTTEASKHKPCGFAL